MMKKILLILGFVILIWLVNCTPKTDDENIEMKYFSEVVNTNDSINYFKFMQSLTNSFDLYYRHFKWVYKEKHSFDYDLFKRDSLTYFNNYENLFMYDIKYVYWLLTYKNDTTNDFLWPSVFLLQHPFSSESFKWPLKNKESALVYIENFMREKTEFEYSYKVDTSSYKKIERFLYNNRRYNINKLRYLWRKNFKEPKLDGYRLGM